MNKKSLQSVDKVEKAEPFKRMSQFRAMLHAIRKNKGALAGLIMVSIFLFIALIEGVALAVGIQLTPFNPIQQHVGPLFSSPNFRYLMGTDNFGRDVFSRVIA